MRNFRNNALSVLSSVCIAIVTFQLVSCDARTKRIAAAVVNTKDEIYQQIEDRGINDVAKGGKAFEGDMPSGQTQSYEIPTSTDSDNWIVLRRKGYTTAYNSEARIPFWVAWHLTREHTEGNVKRPRKAFHEDDDVDYPKATDDDYYNSGYDRGHMCPAADNKWDEDAMMESFLFTNMCPQNHGLNVGDWNEMENQCRRWAKKYGDIYIVCGPILYKSTHKRIGRNKVVVPEAFFKVVMRTTPEPAAIGFVYKNKDGNRPKGDYVNTVDEVERITGFDFFPNLDDDVEDKIEATANLDEWM